MTDQVFIEIDEKEDESVRKRHRRYASQFDTIHADAKQWEPLMGELRARVPNAAKYDSDLRHVVKASAGGARWLVTRDGEFERACAGIVKAVTDVDIVSPGELLVAADALVRDDTYRPTDLAGSSIQFRDLAPGEFDEAARSFLNQREGERLSRLRQMLERAAAKVPSGRVRVLVDGKQFLGLLASSTGQIAELSICRVHRGPAQSTIARQLVALAREEAAASDALAVRLVDPHCGEWVRAAAAAENYLPAGAGFTAMPIQGFGDRASLVARVEDASRSLPEDAVPSEFIQIASTDRAIAMTEQLFHPWRLTGTDFPTFVLPIEAAWAQELFDADIARTTLFPRQSNLALQREHVYYRSPAATGGLTAPARIIWYVKAGPAHDRGLRAVSSLRDVVVGDPRRLYRRFAHLGVYKEAQVLAASDGAKVMALRFSHTSMLPRVISLDSYRNAMRGMGVGVTLQGPQRLPERMFETLVTLTS